METKNKSQTPIRVFRCTSEALGLSYKVELPNNTVWYPLYPEGDESTACEEVSNFEMWRRGDYFIRVDGSVDINIGRLSDIKYTCRVNELTGSSCCWYIIGDIAVRDAYDWCAEP